LGPLTAFCIDDGNAFNIERGAFEERIEPEANGDFVANKSSVDLISS
jgi:hypothetical protein